MSEPLKAYFDKRFSELQKTRRDLHAMAERSWEEVETTAYIVDALKVIGITPHTYENATGCWADIEGEAQPATGKTILLRADIDAMPATDPKDVPYRSRHAGAVHSCGHDGHTTMLLFAARYLFEHKKELRGRVRLVFEAAEEKGEGGDFCVSQGLTDGVDAAFAIHVWGDMDAPYIHIADGPCMAAFNRFKITVHGFANGTGAPNGAKDAIAAAAKIIDNLALLETKMKDPTDALVVAVGKIQGGSAPNTYCDYLTMEGTARTFSPDVLKTLEADIRSVSQMSAALLGCTADVEFFYGHPPIVHDSPLMVDVAKTASRKLFGDDVLFDMKPAMHGDTFSSYCQKVPGIYAWLGVRDVAKGFKVSPHNDYFDFDEEHLCRGAALFTEVVLTYFEKVA